MLDELEIKKLEEKKVNLHKDIEKYGHDLEIILNEISKAEDLKVKIASLTKEVTDLQGQKSILEQMKEEVLHHSVERDSLIRNIEDLKIIIASFSQKLSEINELEKKIASLKSEVKQLDIEKNCNSSKVTELNGKIGEVQAVLSDLEKKYPLRDSELTQRHEERKSDLDLELSKIINDIEHKKEEIGTHDKEIENKKSIQSSLESTISDIEKKLKEIDSTYQTKKIEKEKEFLDRETQLNTRETEVSTREADMSIKESSYEHKRTVLLNLKTRLEKEQGKSIIIEV